MCMPICLYKLLLHVCVHACVRVCVCVYALYFFGAHAYRRGTVAHTHTHTHTYRRSYATYVKMM